MRTHIRKDKIQEALELLNEAAHEKREEVYEIVGDRYEHLKDIFEKTLHNGQEVIGEATKRVSKNLNQEKRKVRDAAVRLDRKAHKDPWVLISSAALGSLVLGMILGRGK